MLHRATFGVSIEAFPEFWKSWSKIGYPEIWRTDAVNRPAGIDVDGIAGGRNDADLQSRMPGQWHQPLYVLSQLQSLHKGTECEAG
ncbi:MAG TPA: hypothetical protein VM165_14225 [Planctomycetaceae bacterium]|nr:hypothetical protein [Planctomycetaceae bacterium]